MVNKEVIKKFAAKYQTTEFNVARDYAQHLFLSLFYQQPESEQVLFKGGTALHIIFQSPRFSENLDFSGFGIQVRRLETLFLNTIIEIQKSALEVKIIESKRTTGGYLSSLHLTFTGYDIRILLQVSLRKQNDTKGESVLITSDFIPSYTLLMLPEEKLIEEKLAALLERSKPRDYFDLYFLLRKGLIRPEKRKVLKKIKIRLSKGEFLFEKELRDFLPRRQHTLIHNFQQILLKEISRYI